MSTKIAERASSRQNNFNVLRLMAAVLVLVSHCYALTGRAEPFATVSGQTLGEVGVTIFFATSGFLIAKSWSDDPRVWPFTVKRALRLLPALIVAVFLIALVLGPLVTTLTASSYFATSEVYRYIAENSVLYTVNGRLPGVFIHNVYPNAVDGSLWTLPVEAVAYVGAAVLGVLGALTKRAAVAVLGFVALLVLSSPLVSLTAFQSSGAVGGNLSLILYLGAVFTGGLLLYVFRNRVPLRWDVALVLTIAWVVSFNTEWVRTTATLAIPYLVLMLAYRTPRALNALTRPGDVSYGIYIYAFPAQQLSAYAVGPHLAPGGMLAIVAAPVYLLALASWRIVESRALRLKARLRPSRAPARAEVPVVRAPSSVQSGSDTALL